jgi:hypothetical protein
MPMGTQKEWLCSWNDPVAQAAGATSYLGKSPRSGLYYQRVTRTCIRRDGALEVKHRCPQSVQASCLPCVCCVLMFQIEGRLCARIFSKLPFS